MCRYLRDHARTIAGKSQLFINAFAKALEVIPRQLCDNAGLDATDILNRLRQQHASRDPQAHNFGVDVNTGGCPSNAVPLMTFRASTRSNPAALLFMAFNIVPLAPLPSLS